MGIFSSKPTAPAQKAAPQQSPKIVAPRSKPAPPPAPIAITGVGVAFHSGEELYALISSVLGQMSGTELSEDYSFILNNGSSALPRMAPVASLGSQASSSRILMLASSALKKAVAQLSQEVDLAQVMIVVMLDPELVSRNNIYDTGPLQQYLIDGMRQLSGATFRFLPNQTASSSSALRLAIGELNEGKWQAVIFGGVDSLISMDTCLALNDDNRLSTSNKSEGIVPGEAAAFVVLQTKDLALRNSSPIKAYLKGVGVAAEPNARAADVEATNGLASAINQALAQAGITATDIKGIVHNLGAETVQSLEWHQTTQAIWPRYASEQQRMAVQNGEIKQAEIPDDPTPKIILPHLTMGEVGAAVLPIQLATALSWIEMDASYARWGLPIRQHLLICDTPYAAGNAGNTQRGAIVISPATTT